MGYATATLLARLPAPSSGSCDTSGGGDTPPGAGFAFGPPVEALWGGERWYNFSIESAGGGLTFGQLTFSFYSPSEGNFTPAGLATVDALWINGEASAQYDVATGTWATGGSVAVTNEYVLAVGPTTSNLSGDTFAVLLAGPCGGEGSVSLEIP